MNSKDEKGPFAIFKAMGEVEGGGGGECIGNGGGGGRSVGYKGASGSNKISLVERHSEADFVVVPESERECRTSSGFLPVCGGVTDELVRGVVIFLRGERDWLFDPSEICTVGSKWTTSLCSDES